MDESRKREYVLRELTDEELTALLMEAPPEDAFTESLLEEYGRRAGDGVSEAEQAKEKCLQALRNAAMPRRRARILRFALVAAAAVLLLAGAVYAFSNGLWSTDKDDFFFWYTKDTGRTQTLTMPSADSTSLAELMTSAGMPDGLVPTYLPEGFEAQEPEAEVYPESSLAMFRQGFVNGNERIEYVYFTSTSPNGLLHPSDTADPELYYSGGEVHYIITEDGRYTAVWQRDSIECSISGYRNREELIRAIDSLYN